MNLSFIAMAAFGGGIVSALLGWLDSKEAFNMRKFGASIIRALIAGVIFAIGYNYTNHIVPMDIATAFVGGSGIEVLVNRIQGAIKGS